MITTPLHVAGLRISAINYFRDRTADFRILPKVGFTAFGYVNLMYENGLPLLKSELTDISRHRFSITLNLFKGDDDQV